MFAGLWCGEILPSPLEILHIADGMRLQLVAGSSVYAKKTAQIAACERYVNGLWGVFIVSVLSVVFLAGFAFLPRRY